MKRNLLATHGTAGDKSNKEDKMESLNGARDDTMESEEAVRMTDTNTHNTESNASAAVTSGIHGAVGSESTGETVARRVTLSPAPDESNKRSLSGSDGESEPLQGNNATASTSTSNDNAPNAPVDRPVEEPPVKKVKTQSVSLGPQPFPTEEEKEAALLEFNNDADRALQRLVWDIGCRYTLMAHQPEAVRAVAGFPPFFPYRRAQDHDADRMSTNEKFKAFPIESKTKGILLADEMGLGKTVESIVGMILRNKWHDAHGKRRLPSVIISPNDTVLRQWYETLIRAGVSKSRIRYYKPRSSTQLEGNFFLLMTRYNIQTEVRALFNKVDMRNRDRPSSPLFPTAPKPLLHKLKNQYQSEKGKAKNDFKQRGESEAACVTRILEEFIESQIFNKRPLPLSFRTIIVDEAHFLKNLCSFWGIGTALLGINAERMVPLTGTPYNNGNQDLASLVTFIDPTQRAAQKEWWDKATSKRLGHQVAEAISDWRTDYMVLRKKEVVLKGKLPPKIIEVMSVSPYMIELFLYEQDEERFLKVLESFRDKLEDASPQAKRRLLELFSYAMAHLSNMRKDLIHSMLSFGRDVSIRFSPSRAHLLPSLEKPKQCVCCKAFNQSKKDKQEEENSEDSKPAAKPRARTTRTRTRSVNWDMDLDDDELGDDDEAQEVLGEDDEDSSMGPTIPLPSDLCDWSEGPCRHFAHEQCVEDMRKDGTTCPSCRLLTSRVHLLQTRISLDENGENRIDDIGVNHNTYCRNITVSPGVPAGFKASAKIERVVAWLRSVPVGEKIIVYSFFKGGLDLIEGILTYDLGIDCARFDGDFVPEVRNAELERFKSSPSCRVLLSTVQSGGTGLNIVCANNICFLDRWFNPTVHAQAQDRCHRIGQKHSSVNVFFADVATTVDEVMRHLNDTKSTNAKIILGDGSELARTPEGSLSFRDLAGMVGDLVRAVQALRRNRAGENYYSPLALLGDENILAEVEAQKALRKRPPVKSEKKETSAATTADTEASSTVPSSGTSSDAAEEHVAQSQPQHPQYATVGGTNALNLLDSDDDDDSLFDDMTPTFKTG